LFLLLEIKNKGTATIRATHWMINASYNQRQRCFI
jgi:hypothetical protein